MQIEDDHMDGSKVQAIQEKLKNVQLSKENNTDNDRKMKSDEQFKADQQPLIMRNIYIIIDATKSSKINDFKPSRLSVIIKNLPQFITKFLLHNPLSQIGVGTAEQYACKHLLDFKSSSIDMDKYLNTIKATSESGFSIAACLQSALYAFSQTQAHTQSSVLLITSSPYSDDKMNLESILNQCERAQIRVDIISFCGVIRILQSITRRTNGEYLSPINEEEFQQLLHKFVIPSHINNEQIYQLVKVGFPSSHVLSQPTLCTCHFKLVYHFFKCPRCLSKICSPPMICPTCEIWVTQPFQILRPTNELQLYRKMQEDQSLCFGCSSITDFSAQCYQCSNNVIFLITKQGFVQDVADFFNIK
ncbi:hypothetical protein pb186bvf_001005 [Paramecium bursaria]